jgi:uncharacterized protein (DUF433 family)
MSTNDTWREHIWIDPDRHGGDPCIRGTRIPVAVLVTSLAEMTMDELLQEYPHLSREDIQAALLYAAEATKGYLAA